MTIIYDEFMIVCPIFALTTFKWQQPRTFFFHFDVYRTIGNTQWYYIVIRDIEAAIF